jgi:UDP-glucose 4-epimerase
MSRVLVTGGCGFIGSHLCLALRSAGHAVRVLDDLSSGSEENLAPGAELILGDVADPATASLAMEGVDLCFHLAAIASVERGALDWLGTHRANLTGAITVMNAARARRIPVIYASSAAIYGDAATLPITEDTPPRPLSAYGADKLGCELHARAAGVVHGIPTLGLRFFNVFGPRQDPRSPYSGVISIFCDRLSRGEAVTIHGDGSQTRDFVPVAQVVAALLAAPRAASVMAPVVNVCTGQATSVRMLAEMLEQACGARGAIRHGPPRSGEIRHSIGSPARAGELLGLGAPPDLRDGLGEVLAWLKAGRPGLSPRPVLTPATG